MYLRTPRAPVQAVVISTLLQIAVLLPVTAFVPAIGISIYL